MMMKSYTSGEARLKMRDILSAVERGEQVVITRYETPTALVVPFDAPPGDIPTRSAAVAEDVWRYLATQVINGMLESGEDPTDTALYKRRQAEVAAALDRKLHELAPRRYETTTSPEGENHG